MEDYLMLNHCDFGIEHISYPRFGTNPPPNSEDNTFPTFKDNYLYVPEGKLLFLGKTGIVSPQEKETLEEIRQELESQPKSEHISSITEDRLAFLKEMSASEVIISLLLNKYIESVMPFWVRVEDLLLKSIEPISYYSAKIPSKERLEEELNYLQSRGYIRFNRIDSGYFIIQPSIRELLEKGEMILC